MRKKFGLVHQIKSVLQLFKQVTAVLEIGFLYVNGLKNLTTSDKCSVVSDAAVLNYLIFSNRDIWHDKADFLCRNVYESKSWKDSQICGKENRDDARDLC